MTGFDPDNPRSTTNERRRPTIHDVARDAGISKTSVSRYFGSERTLLSEAMTARIEASIERLGFRPDRIASSLRGRRTRLIGMVVVDMRNPYTVAMIHGAELACHEHDYSLVVCNTNNDDQLERRHLDVLQGYSVEGLVVNTRGHNMAPLRTCLEEGLPMVLVDRQLEGLDCDMVGLDNEQAMNLAVDHLVEQGYRRLLMISEPASGISSREQRIAGFSARAQETGITATVCESPREEIEKRWLVSTLQHWLAESETPGAIVCANGVVTLAVCHALYSLSDNPFVTTGLLGIDELDWCELVGPGITTVAQPVSDIGHSAITTLLSRLEGKKTHTQVRTFPAQLHPRGSTRRYS